MAASKIKLRFLRQPLFYVTYCGQVCYTLYYGGDFLKKIGFVLVLFSGLFLSACTKKEVAAPAQTSVVSQISSASQSSDSSITSSASATSNTVATSHSASTTANRIYDEVEKEAIAKRFAAWAGYRARIGGMALTTLYFAHGAGGPTDWYAVTPDGSAQAQNLNNPGLAHFPIQVLGGVTFYYSKAGLTGLTDEVQTNYLYADGFATCALLSQPIVKYILGNNGVVYELASTSSFSDGFTEVGRDGNTTFSNGRDFKISEDVAAKNALQVILSDFN
jgi:hypothetical protein